VGGLVISCYLRNGVIDKERCELGSIYKEIYEDGFT